MPFNVTTAPGSTRVDMRCRRCGHEWALEQLADDALVIGRKPDRRASE
jgi:hypothetical protein